MRKLVSWIEGPVVFVLALVIFLHVYVARAQTTTSVAGPTIKLSWAAVTQGTSVTTTNGVAAPPVTVALTGTTYNLYQGACNSTATFAKVQSGIGGTSAVVSLGVTAGVTYGFRITAVNTAMSTPESVQSATVCAVIAPVVVPPPVVTPPVTLPNAPTGLTVLPSS